MEQKRWIACLELSRLIIASWALLLGYFNVWLCVAGPVVLIIMIIYFNTIQRHYLRWVYTAN